MSWKNRRLETLKQSPFNKMRMCVFPKHYAYQRKRAALLSVRRNAARRSGILRDSIRPSFATWKNASANSATLGIEADIILFHPYDEGHWGFDRMDAASDDRYLKYIVARFVSVRNVWWSMANEFDFMKEKKPADWDRYFKIVQTSDPYGHLRSIHNGRMIYDHNKPWVTHASIQNGSAVEDFGRAITLSRCLQQAGRL